MVFPFGISVSDFIAGIKLIIDGLNSLSDTRGARADYNELLSSLKSLQKALEATEALDSLSQVHSEAVDSAISTGGPVCLSVVLQ